MGPEDDQVVPHSMTYRTVPGYRPLLLDLHRPAGAEQPVPLVIFVHGGAFEFGDRASLPPLLTERDLFRWLPAEGFAVASVDYRLSGEAVWPACVEDVVAAVEWLHERAGEFGLDPARTALWGESAGGYLAVAAGLRLPTLGVPVRGIVDWYGPMNFLTMAGQGAPWTDEADSPESKLLGAPVRTVPELARLANPCRLVTAASPPLLIMHGTADEHVPYGQALHLHEAYEKAGAPHVLHPVERARHVFAGRPVDEVTDPVLSFLSAVLR